MKPFKVAGETGEADEAHETGEVRLLHIEPDSKLIRSISWGLVAAKMETNNDDDDADEDFLRGVKAPQCQHGRLPLGCLRRSLIFASRLWCWCLHPEV